MATKCPATVVTVKGEIAKVLEQAKKEAAKKDIMITGNVKSGKIKHKKNYVYGSYSVSGQKIRVDMVDDTMWINCKDIAEAVKKWFKGK